MGNLDKIYRDKLSSIEVSLDKEALWAGVESGLNTPPIVNTSLKTPLISVLFISAMISLMHFYMGQSPSPQAPENSQSQFTTMNSTEENTDEEIKSVDNITVIEGETEISEEISGQSETTDNPRKKKYNKTIAPSKTYLAETLITEPLITPSQPQTQKLQVTEEIIENEAENIIDEAEHTDTRNKIHALSLLNYREEKALPSADHNLVDPCDYVSPPKVECYNPNKKTLPLSLYAYYGPGATFRTLSLSSASQDMMNHLSRRENLEKTLENHRAGLGLKYTTKSGFYAKSGVEYNRINERLKYRDVDTTFTVLDSILINTVEQPDGTIDSIYGIAEGMQISGIDATYYNQFTNIDIPIFIGFESAKGKLAYHAELGVLINIKQTFTGNLFDVTTMDVVENPNYFETKVSPSFHLAAGIGYHLTPQFSLWLDPAIRYQPSTITQSDYVLNQSYLMTNLILTGEYRF